MPHVRVAVLLIFASVSLYGQPRAERALAASVSKERLLRTVRDLVWFGPRTGGTKSGNRAVQYLVDRFKEAGYTPEVVEDPEVLTFSILKWSLRVEEPRSLRRLIKNAWLGGFSPSVGKTRAPLRLMADQEDTRRNLVDSGAVLLDEPPDRRTYEKLVQVGASCILVISPKLEGAYSKWAMISDLRRSAENPIPMFNLSYDNGVRLKEALRDSQEVVISFSAQTLIVRGVPKTVIATLAGDSSAYFLVCAHGDADSGGPGADDNASGVSGVLEIARTLGALVGSKVIPRPKFTIQFAVWGTEVHSTEHYVKSRANDLEQILGVLNIDEIGTGATRDCLYFESNDIEHNEKLLRTLEAVGEEYAGRKGFWAESTTNPSQGGTDSYVFLPNYLRYLKIPEVEIPSVTIYTAAWNELKRLQQTEGWTSKAWKGHPDSVYIDYSAYYHSSLDIPAMTTEREPYNMVGAAKAVGISLLRLAW